jgi:predicted ATP-dependent endonuclease of OLD family
MNQEEDKNETIKLALDKVFYSEFDGELSSKPNQIKSLIQISEGQNPIINLEIKNEKVRELEVYDELSFSDVTFIESSTILQMNQLIDSAITLLEYEQTKVRSESRLYRKIVTVPLHIKDLSIKIGEILRFRDYYTQPSMSAHDDVADHISKTVNGLGVFRDAETKDLYFYKREDLSFKASNTASGIKSFTLLQILLRMDILNERSLLILDEPENHLHPKWQVEYARIIVLLVQKGIPILITSHSPYIIQALRVFSAEAKLQNKTHYYLASKSSDESLFSTIEDVTDDLNKVFVKLSAPLHDLVWIK